MACMDIATGTNVELGLQARLAGLHAPRGGPTIRVPCRAAIAPSFSGSTSGDTVGTTRSSAGTPISANIFS
jgi:hypothetical protein